MNSFTSVTRNKEVLLSRHEPLWYGGSVDNPLGTTQGEQVRDLLRNWQYARSVGVKTG